MYKIIRESTNNIKQIRYSISTKIWYSVIMIFLGAFTILLPFISYMCYVRDDIILCVILALIFIGFCFFTYICGREFINIFKFKLIFYSDKLKFNCLKGSIEMFYNDIKCHGVIRKVVGPVVSSGLGGLVYTNIVYFITDDVDFNKLNKGLSYKSIVPCGLIENKGFYLSDEDGSDEIINSIYRNIKKYVVHIKRVDMVSRELDKKSTRSK